MSEVVADFLEGEPFGQQTDRAGVTQRVPTSMLRFDTECDKSSIGDVKNAARLQRPTRRLHTEEDFLAG